MAVMASFSCCQRARMASFCSRRLASSSSSLASRSVDASSVSLPSATRSISSWRMRRSTTSISVGIESISMRRRDAASSIEVDGLVGQEPAGDVAVAEAWRRRRWRRRGSARRGGPRSAP